METIDVQNVPPPPPPTPEAPPKRKAGRPRRDPDIVQIQQPDYFKNYYHEKRKALVECPVCSRMITKNQISAHKKSMKCRFAGMQKEKQ